MNIGCGVIGCKLVGLTLGLSLAVATDAPGEIGRPGRLEAVDLKERVIWGAEVREPEGRGLAFGGQDQEAEDGRPHTRVWEDGEWVAIHDELRAANPLQRFYDRVWTLRTEAKDLRSQLRHIFFEGRPPTDESGLLESRVKGRHAELLLELTNLTEELQRGGRQAGPYGQGQAEFAIGKMTRAGEMLAPALRNVSAADLERWNGAQVGLELAAEALDAEPPARAIDCGSSGKGEEDREVATGLAYEPKTKLYVLFGGDHLDCLTNDTWVFDPAKRRWFQRHPGGAPPPRANHVMSAPGDGTVVMSGGYTYTSNTDYLGGQYCDLYDGAWVYNVERNTWSNRATGKGEQLVPAGKRAYRSGPFYPDFYQQGERPDAVSFAKRLEGIPVNTWVATDPPHKPRQNRDWGTAVIDPDRDLMLRWSGGHSAHGGTDVPHFHFATNRWELPFPVEFPLGQLYSNTSYPNGFNFNRRPWMTGHTYQNYAYDPPSKLMVKAGRPRHFYLYDPTRGDWIGRGPKPDGMVYDSCFYTLTLTSTPQGAVCWGANGRVHRYDHAAGKWIELELQGETLPGAVVDNSTIAYDAKRDCVYMIVKPYGEPPFSGQVWSLELKTNTVKSLDPAGMTAAKRFAYIDRWVYDPGSDLVLLASYLSDAGAHTRTPAYDPAQNRWVTLDLAYETGRRGDRVTRAFPHGRSCGIMFDPKRNLIWGTDTDSEVYVLRLDRNEADVRELE